MANTKQTPNARPGVVLAIYAFDEDGNGTPENFDGCDTITLQSVGDDGGGTLTVECSNDGTNYTALPTAISLTAAGVTSVAANSLGFLYYRPVLTGATAPSLAVRLVGIRNALARP